MADGCRMGWEVEIHKIKLSWKRQADNVWWPTAAPNFDSWGNTLAPDGTSIFVPADLGPNLAAPVQPAPANIPAFGNEDHPTWTGLWGFRMCPDAQGQGNGGVRGECIIEVNTAAQLISDYHYWYWAQVCLRQFHDAISLFQSKKDGSGVQPAANWRPISDLLNSYNDRVRALPVPGGINDYRRLFGLQLSDRLSRFAAGNPVVPVVGRDGNNIPNNQLTGVRWEPFFAVGQPVSHRDYCDVQVNYSVKLAWLSQNLPTWIALWSGMWTHKLGPNYPDLDPDVGDLAWSLDFFPDFRKQLANPKVEVYRTQLYAAAWRTADNQAGAILANNVNAAYQALPPMDRNLIKGLLTYLLAVGSVTVTDIFGSSKNCTAQLPKTSPAAIARMIRARGPATANVMNTLAGLGAAAQNIMTNEIRSMARLVAVGGLPAGRPQTAVDTLATYSDQAEPENVYKGAAPPNFIAMWSNALNPPAPPVGPANTNYGFTTLAPFHCMWSHDVQTGIPPVQQADTDILIGFESRYNSCILNIGFNPMVRAQLFTKSYLSLVDALANPQLAAATPLIGRDFGWGAVGNVANHIPITLQRNLGAGIH